MKLFSNNRPKLILNRVKKPQTAPKVSLEVVNGCKILKLYSPLSKKDINILKMGNSSIFKKKQLSQINKNQRQKNDNVRCRSTSQIDSIGKSKLKIFTPLQKLNSQVSDGKSQTKKTFQRIVHNHCVNVVNSFKQQGILALKSNFYNISIDSFKSLLTEISQRIVQQAAKIEKKRQIEIQSSKDTDSSESAQKKYQKFQVYNQFSLKQQIRKIKNLSHQSQIINYHLDHEQSCRQEDLFWMKLETYDKEKPSQKSLNFLLDKRILLEQQIIYREIQLKKILLSIDQANKNLAQKNNQISNTEEIIKEYKRELSQVQNNVKQIQSFINKQPNRILQLEAEGYKQSEQQLFDMAFMLQQSAPSSISTFVQQSIMIPFQSFKLIFKSFPHGNIFNDSYSIPTKDMEEFKSSINNTYESTIEKLRIIIEKKAAKINKFVGIMRRLASYTIGKRQYLTQINKKMAIISIKIEKRVKMMQECCRSHNESEQKLKSIAQIKQLIDNMRIIYCQAEVFY